MAPAVTSDGALLAYTVVERRPHAKFGHPGVPWYAVGGDIWITDLTGGPVRRLTGGKGSNWAPSWSPDGRRLAFLSDRTDGVPAGSIHLWMWERASGELRKASDLPLLDPWARLGRLEWLADNRTVIVKTYPEGVTPAAYADSVTGGSESAREEAETGVTVRVFRWDPDLRNPSPGAAANNLDHLLGDLALLDVETGAVRRIVRHSRLASYSLSPNRRILAWATATRFVRPESYQILVDIFAYDLATGQPRRLVTGAPLVFSYPMAQLLSWAPNSHAIAYRTDGPVGSRDQVFVVGVKRGKPRKIAESPPLLNPWSYDARPLWEPGGQGVLFARSGVLWRAAAGGTGQKRLAAVPDRWLRMIEHGAGTLWSPDGGRSTIVVTGSPATKRMGLARVDLRTGDVSQLLEENKWYDTTLGSPPVVTSDGESVLYVTADSRHPPNLWVARADSALRPRQVSDVAPELEKFTGGEPKVIEWRGLDGDTLRGALIYPAGYRKDSRYPLIVRLYGGDPVSDELNRFGSDAEPIENVQVLASRGYAVLLADSRLSVGTPMLALLKSVLPGVNRAIELGVADPGRIGLMGHSFGGYNTLGLIAQSRIFKAAVMRGGFGDLLGMYGHLSPDGVHHNLPWAEQGQGSIGGTPWEFRERYVENSPVWYLDRVDTPLLIVHGAEDGTVKSFLPDQVFVGLRRLGKEVEYARYAGEGHTESLWSLANQIDYLTRVISWFDRHLKGNDGSAQPHRSPVTAP